MRTDHRAHAERPHRLHLHHEASNETIPPYLEPVTETSELHLAPDLQTAADVVSGRPADQAGPLAEAS
jgi:hypothetical protein